MEDCMLTHITKAGALCTVAVLTFATAGRGQTATPVMERFTFKVATAEKAGPTGTGRLDLVINHWSSEADRANVFEALEEGTDKLADAIWRSPLVGSLHWPGNMEYGIRYAYKTTRSDGEDLILVTDRPVWLFWDEKAPQPAVYGYNVIQLRIDRNGNGEGKLGTKVTPNKNTKTFVLENYPAQSALLTDVRRERTVG
jgi:hypothetical protein